MYVCDSVLFLIVKAKTSRPFAIPFSVFASILLILQWITTYLIVDGISRFSARHSTFSNLSPRILQLKMFLQKNGFYTFGYLEIPWINKSPNNTVYIFLFVFNVDIYCLCVCARACVCVFVFLDFHRKGFLPLQQWCLQYTWLYKSTILWCEYYSRCFCQVSLSPFLNMSYLTSKDESPASQQYNTLY